MDIRRNLRSGVLTKIKYILILISIFYGGDVFAQYYTPYNLDSYTPVINWYRYNSTESRKVYIKKTDCSFVYYLIADSYGRLYYTHSNANDYHFPVTEFTDELGLHLTRDNSSEIQSFHSSNPTSASNRYCYRIDVTIVNNSSISRNWELRENGTVLESGTASGLQTLNHSITVYNRRNDTTYNFELYVEDRDLQLISVVSGSLDAVWTFCDSYMFVNYTIAGSPFDIEIESPFDNDAPDTELPVPDDWYPDDWEYPETEDLPDDSFIPPDFDDLPDSEPPDEVDRDNTQWQADSNIPDAPETLNDNDSNITQQDLYEAVYKALNNSGQKYDFDQLDELDNEAFDNDGGLISELENTSQEFGEMLQRNRTAFNKMKDKVEDIHTLNLPQQIGTIDSIEITIPVLEETYTFDLTVFEDNIKLFRSVVLMILGIINWIMTMHIIRQGIS